MFHCICASDKEMRGIVYAERQDVTGNSCQISRQLPPEGGRPKVDSNQGEERRRGRECDFINVSLAKT